MVNMEQELEPKEFLKWKENTLKEPMENVVGKYTKELTRQEAEIFLNIAGEVLKRYGYSEH